MKKILIIGAQGYLGSCLTDYLQERGYSCTGIDTGFFRNGVLYEPLPVEMIRKDARAIKSKDIEGYDVVVTFDMKAWELASEKDRIRIMSHELRHIFIDEKGKIKLLPHDISDFRAEQKLNEDDPDWGFKLATLVNDVYDQEKELAKQKKGE